jgi:dephospho-CoA kinase
MKTKIVMLLGLSFAGKDTIGQMFCEQGYTRISFADQLKYKYAEMNNLDPKILFEQGEEKEKHRPGLIHLAETEKLKDPLVWLNLAFKPYRKEDGEFEDNHLLVVTDCRRVCEIDWAVEYKNREIDLYIIEILRDEATQKDKDHLTHYCIGYANAINRYGMLGFINCKIDNNSTLEVLKRKIDYVIKQLSQ